VSTTLKKGKRKMNSAKVKSIAMAVGAGLVAIYLANKIPAIKKIVGGV
jgi:hypothetical protein